MVQAPPVMKMTVGRGPSRRHSLRGRKTSSRLRGCAGWSASERILGEASRVQEGPASGACTSKQQPAAGQPAGQQQQGGSIAAAWAAPASSGAAQPAHQQAVGDGAQAAGREEVEEDHLQEARQQQHGKGHQAPEVERPAPACGAAEGGARATGVSGAAPVPQVQTGPVQPCRSPAAAAHRPPGRSTAAPRAWR